MNCRGGRASSAARLTPLRRLDAGRLRGCEDDARLVSKRLAQPVSNRIQPVNVITLIRSSDFDEWLRALADLKAKARILARLRSATFGAFGDCEAVGEGVSEMRIHIGPGYRVYFVRTGATVYVLLTGGDKSRQKQDIARAKRMARALKEMKP
jgi:putative addiction module killer protein